MSTIAVIPTAHLDVVRCQAQGDALASLNDKVKYSD